MRLLIETFLDSAMDSLHMLPFLFVAFLLIETMEHYSGEFLSEKLEKVGKSGPLVGALAGCIPQCGFSVMASNLYAGGLISLGTLMAVFIATSDEAVLIILGNPGQGKEVLTLLGVKVLLGIIAGYLIDLFLGKYIGNIKWTGVLCDDCGCNDHGHHKHKHLKLDHIIKPAVMHTVKIFIYVFLFTWVLNALIECIGIKQLSAILLSQSLLQPMIAALIGLIPNCAASVALTQLYLEGIISFASVIAGLCSGAGVGLVVLFRVNRDKKENIRILIALYILSAVAGGILNFLT